MSPLELSANARRIEEEPARSSCLVRRANLSRPGYSAGTKVSFRWRMGGLSEWEKSLYVMRSSGRRATSEPWRAGCGSRSKVG